MASPFPGMDPYLEQSWRDVHTALIASARQQLNDILPGDLIARAEERVAIETEEEIRKALFPDLRVFESASAAPATAATPSSAAAVAEPVLLKAQVEPHVERYITIVEVNTEHLITVVEFLSPSNKRPGEGMRHYLTKRKQLIDAGVNVVEIDLVRQGDWVQLLLPYMAHPRHHTTYRVTTRRATEPGQVELYPIPLRQRLPIIPIPLRASDRDVTLDLQSLLDQAYRNGRYDRTIDYARPCDPPLPEEDAAWARHLAPQR